MFVGSVLRRQQLDEWGGMLASPASGETLIILWKDFTGRHLQGARSMVDVVKLSIACLVSWLPLSAQAVDAVCLNVNRWPRHLSSCSVCSWLSVHGSRYTLPLGKRPFSFISSRFLGGESDRWPAVSSHLVQQVRCQWQGTTCFTSTTNRQ